MLSWACPSTIQQPRPWLSIIGLQLQARRGVETCPGAVFKAHRVVPVLEQTTSSGWKSTGEMDETTSPSSSPTTTTNSRRRMRAAAPAAEKQQEDDHNYYYYWRPQATTAAAIEDAEPYMYKPYPSLNDLPDNVDTTNHRWDEDNNDDNNTTEHPNNEERRHHHVMLERSSPSFSSERRRPSSLYSSAARTPGNDFPLNVSRRTRSTCSTDEQHGTASSVPSTNERPAYTTTFPSGSTAQEEEQFYQQRIRTTSFDRLPMDIAVPRGAAGPEEEVHEEDPLFANLYHLDRKPSASSFSPSKKKAAPEKSPTSTMIEVSPGTHVRLRGAAETWEAVQADFYTPCQCLVCGSSSSSMLAMRQKLVVPIPRVVPPSFASRTPRTCCVPSANPSVQWRLRMISKQQRASVWALPWSPWRKCKRTWPRMPCRCLRPRHHCPCRFQRHPPHSREVVWCRSGCYVHYAGNQVLPLARYSMKDNIHERIHQMILSIK